MDTTENSHPTQQTVAILQNQGPDFTFEIQTTTVPALEPRQVLVKLEVSGFCGTDVSLASGHLGPCNPVLGHEGVGRIVKLGAMCEDRAAVVGQRVGIGWIRDACRSCRSCISSDGGETRCRTQVFSGRDVPGTLADFAVVPDRYITPLPEDVPSQLLAPIMCAGVTAYKALKITKAVSGSWVAIVGAAGGVGSLALQYARAMGYRSVAIDCGDTQKSICLEAGAEVYLDSERTQDLQTVIERETEGNLCSAAIVCAGSALAYESALPCLDYYGTLVAIGIPPPTSLVSFHPITLIDRGIKLVGSVTGDRQDVIEAVEFVRRNLVKPKVMAIGINELSKYCKQTGGLDGKLVVRLEEDGKRC